MEDRDLFDRSFLPEAEIEFVLIADTHYMADSALEQVEFESRRLQTARIETVLKCVESLHPDFVVHLGDVTQHYPESDGFVPSIKSAMAQLENHGLCWHHVPGNHDVGDKPDPTMPTNWVSGESLHLYKNLIGPSWHSWNLGRYHFIALNSQILNSTLPEAGEQDEWLKSNLEEHKNEYIFLFLHLPLYLENENEPALGHYDNIGQPARKQLIDLIKKYNVRLVCAGHSHYPFLDYIGNTRYQVMASPSFTRPGFGELFSSCPPPERGRDDTGKLGFYLIRVHRGEPCVHFLRTSGKADGIDIGHSEQLFLNPLTSENQDSFIGLTLRNPISWHGEVPIAFPSIIRQKVRNDLQLLAVSEAGMRFVRVPGHDLRDAYQRERLSIMKKEGVELIGLWPWVGDDDFIWEALNNESLISGVEVQLLGANRLDSRQLKSLRRWRDSSNLPLSMSVVLPNQRVAGKQHNRPRFGFLAEELAGLERDLQEGGVWLDSILCRIDTLSDSWRRITGIQEWRSNSIKNVDWLFEFSATDEAEQSVQAAEVIFAAATAESSRLFLEPLVDLDRTMDTAFGLLDRLHNPRPVFKVVRCLSSLISNRPFQPVGVEKTDRVRIFTIHNSIATFSLVIPDRLGEQAPEACLEEIKSFKTGDSILVYDLARSMKWKLDHPDKKTALTISGPLLLTSETG